MPVLTEGLTEMSLKRPKDPHVTCRTIKKHHPSRYHTRVSVSQNTYDALFFCVCVFLFFSLFQAYLAAYLLAKSNYPGADDLRASLLAHAGVTVNDTTAGGKKAAASAAKQAMKIIIAGAPCRSGHNMAGAEEHNEWTSPDFGLPLSLSLLPLSLSGKGSQAEFIKSEYGVFHLSTGDLLRAEVAAGSPLGLAAKEFMDTGRLVTDDLIINIVKAKVTDPEVEARGWLLDGFPRTAVQAQALKDAGINADLFIQLDVPDDVLIKRVTGRRTDEATGRTYHVDFDPPPADVADRCIQRSDDTEEKIQTRLKAFHNAIAAISELYADVRVVLDGNRKKDVITTEIREVIDAQLGKQE